MRIARTFLEWLQLVAIIAGILLCFCSLLLGVTQAPPTQGERFATLQQWRETHQKADDDQFAQLKALNDSFQATSKDRETRLTRLETQYVEVSKKIDSVSDRLWVLIVAICGQLLHIVYEYLKPKGTAQAKGAGHGKG